MEIENIFGYQNSNGTFLNSRVQKFKSNHTFTISLQLKSVLKLFCIFFIKNRTAKSALRLKVYGKLKHDHFEHGIILRGLGSLNLVQESDYLLPKSKFGNIFRSRIPVKKANSVFKDYVILVFSYVSNTKTILEYSLVILIFLCLLSCMHSFSPEICAKRINQSSFCTSTINI